MNILSPFPIGSYSSKVAGFVITGTGFVLICWLQFSAKALTWVEFNLEEQVKLGFWIFSLGLYLMAFSKEKLDDERVQRIRQVSLRISFQLLIAIYLAAQIANLVARAEVDFSIIPVTISLVLYHLIFYTALVFNPKWAYSDVTGTENFRMNKKFYLIYALALVLLFAAIALVNYFQN